MPKYILVKSCFILFLASVNQKLFCQIQSWNHTLYTTKDGLPSNIVRNVTQDDNGFMWIATESGLCRFDGDEFVKVLHDDKDSTSIPTDQINGVHLSPNNEVLVSTAKGLYVLNTKNMKGYTIHNNLHTGRESLDDNFGAVFVNKKLKQIVVYTSTSFVYFDYSFKKLKTITYPFPNNNTSSSGSLTNYRPIFFSNGDVLFHDNYSTKFGIVKYKNKVIIPLSKDSTNAYFALANFNNIDCSRMDSYGNIWIHKYGSDTLYCCKPNSKLVKYPLIGEAKNASWLGQIFFPDAHHMIWGFNKNVSSYIYELPYDELITNSNCPIEVKNQCGFAVSCYTHFKDKDNNEWIASNQGLFLLKRGYQHFQKIDLPLQWKWESTWQFVVDIKPIDRDNLLMPSSLQCFLYNKKSNTIQTYMDTVKEVNAANYRIDAIIPLSNNRQLLLGEQDLVFQNNKVSIGLKPTNKFEQLFKKYATNCYFKDSKGNQWVCFHPYGVVKWNPTTQSLSSYIPKKDYDDIIFTSIAENSNGEMWFTNHAQSCLWKMDKRTSKFEKITLNIPALSTFTWVNGMMGGANNLLYLSTAQGLTIFNTMTHAYETIGMKNGLSCSKLEGLFYWHPYLFISTKNGLNILDTKDNTIQVLNHLNGIVEDITSQAFYLDTLENTLYLGGKGCVYKINLATLFHTENPVKVVINQYTVNNKPIDLLNGGMTLSANQNNISFSVSSIDFHSGINKKYFYRIVLNNTLGEWIQNTSKEFGLINLSPGEYTIEIRSKDTNGRWSINTASLSFIIRKPWYNQWWFYVLCGLLIFGIIYIFYRSKLNQLIKVNDIRNRLSQDLHDDIGSTLSSINILSRTAQTNLTQTQDEKTKASLEKINERSQRLLDNMSDIIWNINPGNDTIEEVMSRMREYATTILEAKNIDYTFNFPKEIMACKLTMEVKNNMYLIFKEAVNNLSKYSGCTHANLSLIFDEKNIHLKIEDNGIGFNEQEIKHRGGLSNMQHRAKEINGSIKINSIIEKGTAIELTMPRYC